MSPVREGRKTGHNGRSGLALFAPSLLEGFARLLDLGGTLAPQSSPGNPAELDYFALRSDWEAVGRDLWTSMESAREHQANAA